MGDLLGSPRVALFFLFLSIFPSNYVRLIRFNTTPFISSRLYRFLSGFYPFLIKYAMWVPLDRVSRFRLSSRPFN